MIPHILIERLPSKFQSGIRRILPKLPIPIAMPNRICWVTGTPGGLDFSVVNIEKPERRFVTSFLKPGMTVLDVGAHHGLYTTLMSKLVGPSGRVIAFEPSPRELVGLTRHLRLNGCRNVSVAAVAVGSAAGAADLYVVQDERSGANSLRRPQLDGRLNDSVRISVPVTALDQYLSEHGISHVDFIKMDIEGAELDAFKGAARLLTGRDKPALMVEMSDMVTAPWGYPAREKYDLLSAWDYQWSEISPDGELSPSPIRDHYDGFENLVARPSPDPRRDGSRSGWSSPPPRRRPSRTWPGGA